MKHTKTTLAGALVAVGRTLAEKLASLLLGALAVGLAILALVWLVTLGSDDGH